MERRSKIVVVAGPTGSGKSALALGIAEALKGSVINADSMQVYRDLSVLTARPTAAEEARVPHRLYGVLDGAEPCSAAAWAGMAEAAIAEAEGAGRLPILCGGTGLYIRTLLDGIAPVPEIAPELRRAARERRAERGPAAFHAELALLDPEAAARLPAGDTQRVLRAYEVVKATGRPLKEWQKAGRRAGRTYEPSVFVLMPPRTALYAGLDARFVRMIEAGALDEVRTLLERRLDPALPIMKAVGVPELAAHLAGRLPLEGAIEAARQASRRYAKRQYTWFRHQLSGSVIRIEQFSNNLAAEICHKIRSRT